MTPWNPAHQYQGDIPSGKTLVIIMVENMSAVESQSLELVTLLLVLAPWVIWCGDI